MDTVRPGQTVTAPNSGIIGTVVSHIRVNAFGQDVVDVVDQSNRLVPLRVAVLISA